MISRDRDAVGTLLFHNTQVTQPDRNQFKKFGVFTFF